MDKVQIDKAVQILRRIAETGDFNYISQLNQLIKNQDEISQKIESNPEEIDIAGLFGDISKAIQAEIPEEELGYFYAEVYSIGRGLDEVLGIVGEKKEIAQSIWYKRIEERTEGKDDEEKLKISEEYDNKEIGEMALLHLSDSKKVDVLKGEKTYTRGFEKKLIESIKNPQLKIEAIRESELSEKDIIDIVLNEDDNLKIQAVKMLESGYAKETVLQSIKDPKKRLELINQIMPNNENYKKQCINEIEDPKERLEIGLKEIKDEQYKAELIMEIEDTTERLETALKELKGEVYKSRFIMEIKEPEERIKMALSALQDDKQKATIINKTYIAEGETVELLEKFTEEDRVFLATNFQDSKIKKEALTMFEGLDYIDIANTLDDKDKLELLENDREEENEVLIRGIRTPEVMIQAIDKLNLEPKQKETLKRLYQKNNDVMKGIDFRILEDRYIESLGEDKINLISCYPGEQNSILQLEEKEYEFFCKSIETYMQGNEKDAWTNMASNILQSLRGKAYSELFADIESFENVDIEKLTKIMLCSESNAIGIKNVDDIKNYENLKKEKCDRDMDSATGKQMNAVMLKLFGIEERVAKYFVSSFGQDIDCIDDSELKYFIQSLDAIMQVDDEQTLKTIYKECEEVSLTFPTDIATKLKTAYGKKFNEGLYTPKEGDVIEEDELPEELRNLGVKVYDAGTEFKMLVTSIAPYERNVPNDFKKDWNRPAIGSQFFCASYIRNDMQGTASIPHVCYGFSKMKEDSLLMSGPTDIGSGGSGGLDGIASSKASRFYSPDTQINMTEGYNEMNFRRTQGGEKKQPDYIIAFKNGKEIWKPGKIIQAVKDWENEIPVVMVDVDKCLESEKGKVAELMKQYETTPNSEIAKKIMQKVRNNRMTNSKFCQELQEELDKMETSTIDSMDTLEENYQTVTAQERQEGMSELRRIHQKIKEIREAKEGENDGREGE